MEKTLHVHRGLYIVGIVINLPNSFNFLDGRRENKGRAGYMGVVLLLVVVVSSPCSDSPSIIASGKFQECHEELLG